MLTIPLAKLSDNDWTSDILLLERGNQFELAVAARRYVDLDLPPLPGPPPTGDALAEWFEKDQEIKAVRNALLSEAETAPIGGEYDGKVIHLIGMTRLINHLAVIKEAGYRVPAELTDALEQRGADQERALILGAEKYDINPTEPYGVDNLEVTEFSGNGLLARALGALLNFPPSAQPFMALEQTDRFFPEDVEGVHHIRVTLGETTRTFPGYLAFFHALDRAVANTETKDAA